MTWLQCNNGDCPQLQYVRKARELLEQIDALSNVLWKLFGDDFLAMEEFDRAIKPLQELADDFKDWKERPGER